MSAANIHSTSCQPPVFFNPSSVNQGILEWLEGVHHSQDTDVEEWAYLDTLRTLEKNFSNALRQENLHKEAFLDTLDKDEMIMLAGLRTQAFHDDAYIDTLEREKKVVLGSLQAEAFEEDAYFDTLEREEFWALVLVWKLLQPLPDILLRVLIVHRVNKDLGQNSYAEVDDSTSDILTTLGQLSKSLRTATSYISLAEALRYIDIIKRPLQLHLRPPILRKNS